MTAFDDPREELHELVVRTSGKHAGITFDGQQIGGLVSSVNIDLSEREPYPVVALRLGPKAVGETLFEGLAVVVVESEQTLPGPAVVEFLSAMDPEEVEKAALARTDLGHGPGATTAAILTQLMEWASGRS